MKKLSYNSVTIIVFALFLSLSLSAQAQTVIYKPKDVKLYNTILHQDSVMFNAFNSHNIAVLKKIFAKNVEFYNDGGGLTDYQTTIANFAAMFARNQNTGLRRELVKESLEVYPIPGFGAIELGTHRFIHIENGKQEIGTMKFIHTWQYKDGEWKATRVISLGH